MTHFHKELGDGALFLLDRVGHMGLGGYLVTGLAEGETATDVPCHDAEIAKQNGVGIEAGAAILSLSFTFALAGRGLAFAFSRSRDERGVLLCQAGLHGACRLSGLRRHGQRCGQRAGRQCARRANRARCVVSFCRRFCRALRDDRSIRVRQSVTMLAPRRKEDRAKNSATDESKACPNGHRGSSVVVPLSFVSVILDLSKPLVNRPELGPGKGAIGE